MQRATRVALVECGFRGTGAAAQVLQTKGPIRLWAMADLVPNRLEASLKLTLDSPSPLPAGRDGTYPVPQPGILTNREY